GILIVSDANTFLTVSEENYDRTFTDFLKVVHDISTHIAWVNPMPPERWSKESMVGILEYARMYPYTRQGMEAAVDVMRGRIPLYEY
ncbi:MAG: hypothetical protein AAF787_22240, partial [Chloroflexota bacterium]